MRPPLRARFIVAGAATLLSASLLHAQPVAPVAAPVVWPTLMPPVDFSLPTTAGRPRSVAQYRGRVVIIFYESRDAQSQNEFLKNALGAQGRRDPSMRQRFALIPVANVGEFHFFPAETFAREAISAVARHNHVELWFDWERALVRRLGLRDGASNVVVLDRHGRLRYRRSGRIPPGEVNLVLRGLANLANES